MVIGKDFKFIDLFAGIGGFHCAMQLISPKAKCVMACEIDEKAKEIYKNNFGIEPLGDIRKIDPKDIEPFDVICAGFPCQTFSKAGSQTGFKDPRGTLFQEIIRIAEFHRPKFMILENVANLIGHDHGDTWRTIQKALTDIGYNVVEKPIVISPKDLGIPQLRDRAIIPVVRNDIYSGPIALQMPKQKNNSTNIFDIIEEKISDDTMDYCKLSEYELRILQCWDDFKHGIDRKIYPFPVWSDEFGFDYDISDLPKWKQNFINHNRKLYDENKKFIDEWLKKWKVRETLPPTHRKFEWNCSDDIDSVFDGIIQFRPSGVRVKRPTESPTLVAMTHIPIIGKERRYITVREAARLQSFPDSYSFDESPLNAYHQLGNAVNVKVIEFVFKTFLDYLDENIGG